MRRFSFLRPPYGDIDERTASYIQQKHGKTIVLWSDDSTDSTGGSTQDSINFYNGFANENPKRPHMTLSHETEPSGYNAMYAGTVGTLARGGVNLVTVAQCLDANPYMVVQQRSERDSTWYCGGTWNPPTTTTTRTTSTSTRTTSTSTSTRTSTSTSSTPAPTCVQTYTSKAGDTCASIESQFGLSSGAILAANSFLNCQDIWAYTPICIPPGGSTSTRSTSTTPTSTSTRTTSTSTTSTSTSGPAPSCVSTYTAVAGDTCAKIEYNYELPSGSIQAANPSWLNCSDIWAYTPICIPPGGTGCTLKISTVAGDNTCSAIASRYGITVAQLQAWNPSWLNCNDVWTNTPLCVRH